MSSVQHTVWVLTPVRQLVSASGNAMCASGTHERMRSTSSPSPHGLRSVLVLLALVVAAPGCNGGEGTNTDAGETGTDAGEPGTDAGTPEVDASTGPDAFVEIDAGPDPVPVFRNPVDTPDAELAQQALRILGAPAAGATTPYCNECHSLTRERIRYWRGISSSALSECLTDLTVSGGDDSAAAMVLCLRRGDAAAPFTAERIGVFSTATHLPWFQYVVRHGVGDGWEAQHAELVERAGMPATGFTPMTQADFDIVAEWFIRGVPELDSVLPVDPAPTTCTPMITGSVAAHVTSMATTGWRALNEERGLLMHGCAGASDELGCFATETRAGDTTFGAGWEHLDGATLRVLYTTDYQSSYWTRSSADGRFVGHGARVSSSTAARIIDLASDRVISLDASYDPAFFPDNSGFAFMARSGYFCETSVLTTGMPTRITFMEAGCETSRAVGLYEHVAASLGGGDYWAVSGNFESDDGGRRATLSDPDAAFDSASRLRITPMVNSGSGFTPATSVYASTPYEGDTVISPSSRLLVSRVAGRGGAQLGYSLRRLDGMRTGDTWTVAVPQIARYCMNGGKPGFSYDERWMTIHHYVTDADAVELGFTGPTDPGFAEYRTRGAANVYLVDLVTGSSYRVTHMQPGQYALYPHFRSDGWIYFMVRTSGSTPEHVVVSDAALVLERL